MTIDDSNGGNDDRPVIVMNAENRPYLDALARIAAGLTDDAAIDTLTGAVVELMELRARLRAQTQDSVDHPIATPEQAVERANAELTRITLEGDNAPLTLVEGSQAVDEHGDTYPVVVVMRHQRPLTRADFDDIVVTDARCEGSLITIIQTLLGSTDEARTRHLYVVDTRSLHGLHQHAVLHMQHQRLSSAILQVCAVFSAGWSYHPPRKDGVTNIEQTGYIELT